MIEKAMSTQSTTKSKIFFDGACIVCDMEISYYKRKNPEIFDLVDISSPTFDAKTYGLTPEEVQLHMHVLTPDGRIAKGVDAFAHIWSRMPMYKPVAFLIKLPGIYMVARIFYRIFASYIRPLLPKKNKQSPRA